MRPLSPSLLDAILRTSNALARRSQDHVISRASAHVAADARGATTPYPPDTYPGMMTSAQHRSVDIDVG
jgi:hypothetical protein